MYKFIFKYLGLEKLPLAGFRTYIMIAVGTLAAIMPDVMQVINEGRATDLDFIIDIGMIVVPALLAAGFKKAGVETAKAEQPE